VNADELTYPLHVILRFEIEQDLISGKLAVKDLPVAWNKKMQEYIGITPPTNTEGCLQDIHWSAGLVGYFPTYTIGAMFASQLTAAMRKEQPDFDQAVARGDFSNIHAWLRTNIHAPGRRYETKELIHRATGKDPSPEDYLKYLTTKFSELYEI
jgi:carboxypeptidase Taq